jgi:hypothetical protein
MSNKCSRTLYTVFFIVLIKLPRHVSASKYHFQGVTLSFFISYFSFSLRFGYVWTIVHPVRPSAAESAADGWLKNALYNGQDRILIILLYRENAIWPDWLLQSGRDRRSPCVNDVRFTARNVAVKMLYINGDITVFWPSNSFSRCFQTVHHTMPTLSVTINKTCSFRLSLHLHISLSSESRTVHLTAAAEIKWSTEHDLYN